MTLKPLPKSEWYTPLGNNLNRFACWSGDRVTVQGFAVPGDIIRLSVNRNERIPGSRLFAEGISWDELQTIKRECGYGDRFAVEVYPEDRHILNEFNARHIWLLPNRLSFAWSIDQTGRVNR
jgi:hypothetical protein